MYEMYDDREVTRSVMIFSISFTTKASHFSSSTSSTMCVLFCAYVRRFCHHWTLNSDDDCANSLGSTTPNTITTIIIIKVKKGEKKHRKKKDRASYDAMILICIVIYVDARIRQRLYLYTHTISILHVVMYRIIYHTLCFNREYCPFHRPILSHQLRTSHCSRIQTYFFVFFSRLLVFVVAF